MLQTGERFRMNSWWIVKWVHLQFLCPQGCGGATWVGRWRGNRFSCFELNGFFLPFTFRPDTWEFMALSKQSPYLLSGFICRVPCVLMQHLCLSLNMENIAPLSCTTSQHTAVVPCGSLVTVIVGSGLSGCDFKLYMRTWYPDNIKFIIVFISSYFYWDIIYILQNWPFKIYRWVGFSIFTKVMQPLQLFIPEHFHHPKI